MSSATATRPSTKPTKPTKSPAPALKGMTDDLRREVVDIQGKINEFGEHSIRSRHDLGQRIDAIIKDGTGRYGSTPWEDMQRAMPLSRSSLKPMLVFAQAYTRADVDRLVKLRNPSSGEHLTWSHVIALTRVKDRDKMWSLAERAATRGMAVKDLNKEVIKFSRPLIAVGGGRKRKKHETLDATLGDVTDKARAFENSAVQVWLAPGGLTDQMAAQAAVAGWRPSADLIAKAAGAREGVNRMLMQVSAVAQALGAVGSQLDAIAAKAAPAA